MDGEGTGKQSGRLGSRQVERSRIEIMIEARDGQDRLLAKVTDISVKGLRLETLVPLKLGQTHSVNLPTIEARCATVIWVDGFVAGCVFAEPLTPDDLANVLASVSQEPDIIDRRGMPRTGSS